ncbi:MAG: iron-containing alcohol dehydrogenase [Hyphomicrobiales bacterium]|nr:iron-containing alcohol dehydrogenase [Hyphomicrobiales bacterium]
MDTPRAITLHLPRRIEIGAGSAALVGDWAQGFSRILVVVSRSTRNMVARLNLKGDVRLSSDIPAEPKDTDLATAIEAARAYRPDLVVGLGGGSVMDVAKLVAVLWDSDQDLADVVGPNRVAQKRSGLAQIATTAGTGSEGGIRALVTSTETGMKLAVESPHMAADLVALDPEVTMSVPPALTAATGVDALAHSVEALTNIRAHPLIDDYARMGIKLAGQHLAHACADATDADARTGMLLSSFYGGLCLGPVNTAAGHALAYPLSTRGGLGHGLAVALMFPHVLAFNAGARPEKTAKTLAALGIEPTVDPAQIADRTSAWCKRLGLNMSLAAHGVRESDLSDWAAEAHGIRRLMDNNPRDMRIDDVAAIYRAAL